MTHTLHPEIEEAIEKMIDKIQKIPDRRPVAPLSIGLDCRGSFKRFIMQNLGKYLSVEKQGEPYLNMPQPIENEPVCAVCGGLGVRENHQATNAQEQFVECRGCKEDKEPLPEKTKYGYDPEARIPNPYELMEQMGADISKKFEEEQKQSNPKIEKIDIAYMKGCGEQTVWEQPIIVKKINEIIDYINNTLPTKL